MGSFKIVSVSDVEVKMALPHMEAAVPVIEAAINTAQLRMESALHTQFDKGNAFEEFFCDPDLHNVVPNGFFPLRLSRGFLREDTVEVTVGGRDITSECVIKHHRGYVYVPEAIGNKQTVGVAYEYGFEEGDTIPSWLKDATLTYVPAAFYMGNPDVRNDASSSQVIDMTATQALAIVAPYQRKMNFSIPPLYPLD